MNKRQKKKFIKKNMIKLRKIHPDKGDVVVLQFDPGNEYIYKCDYCGELFSSEEWCLEHENTHKRSEKANEMLDEGKTLEGINNECHLWPEVPKHLKNVTKDNCFVISYWQCCDKPAYRIVSITHKGRLELCGCGSWNGYYGGELSILDNNLKNPRPKKELFVDPRYKELYGY